MLTDVSETALWAAVLRAQESARPDAIFRDPFAEQLAGSRGRVIATRLARLDRGANGWAMIVRTRIIDDLVLRSVAEGYDCVLSLAAGLDSRPYRLALPGHLVWIEADLPPLIEHKRRALARETPACRLHRVALDLADNAATGTLFEEVATAARKVLVLSEGVLVYLRDAEVRALARGLSLHPAFRRWLIDLVSPGVLTMMERKLGLALARAPLRFAPPEGVAYFESLGWWPREVRPLLPEGARLARVPRLLRRFADSPAPDPRRLYRERWSAVVELERSADPKEQ